MIAMLAVGNGRHSVSCFVGRVAWVGLLVVLLGPALGHGQGVPAKKLAGALTPTKIQLKFTDLPVDRAVEELSRRSGYFIFLSDDEGAGELKKRTVTLDTGEVTFWDAYQQLCVKGGLAEGAGVALTPKTLPKLPPPPKPGDPIPLIKIGDGAPMSRTVSGVLNLKDATRAKDPSGIWRSVPESAAQSADTVTAVRVQASKLFLSLNRDSAPLAAGQVRCELRLTPEPKLLWLELVGTRIDRAIDENGQILQAAKNDVAPKFGGKFGGGGAPGTEGGGFSNPFTGDNFAYVPVRLAKGAKPSTTIKELKGAISARVSMFGQEILAVEDIAKSQGKVIKGAKGGSIKVGPTLGNDQADVQFTLELNLPAQFIPVARLGAANSATPLPGLKVLDAGGKSIPILSMVRSNPKRAPGPELAPGVSAEFTVVVRPAPGQTATKVSYSTRQSVVVDIPFSLENVAVR